MSTRDASTDQGRFPAGRLAFPHRDLTGIGKLQRHEILYLLEHSKVALAVALPRHRQRITSAAAKASHHIGTAQGMLQAPPELLDQFVAVGVTQGVVHLFKVINI